MVLTLHPHYLSNNSKWHCTLPLSDSRRDVGKFSEAEVILKEWLPIAEELLGEQSILVGQVSAHLAELYKYLHMYNESR